MDEIYRAIPHRPPFLFVDRALEMDETSIVAEKFLAPDLDFFKGHYPDFPVMPGVLTLESLFQAGAILLSKQMGESMEGVPVLTRIRDAKFKKMIRPGDTITLEVRIESRVASAFYMKGVAKISGKIAATVSFTCALAPMPGQ